MTTGPYLNPEGTPLERMTPCNADGPYGWIDNQGHVKPIRCNRPRAHTADHAYSTRREAQKLTWTASAPTVHSTSLKGPWQVIQRLE